MALDTAMIRHLTKARERIIAQLSDLEFRVTGKSGAWRRRGSQDRGDIYDVLRNELGEINALLGLEPDNDEKL